MDSLITIFSNTNPVHKNLNKIKIPPNQSKGRIYRGTTQLEEKYPPLILLTDNRSLLLSQTLFTVNAQGCNLFSYLYRFPPPIGSLKTGIEKLLNSHHCLIIFFDTIFLAYSPKDVKRCCYHFTKM